MNQKYVIGVDYGTESGRAVLISVSDGEEIAIHVTPYKHGVIDELLPGAAGKLGHDWALQHPEDYIEVLECSIPAVIEKSGIHPNDVIGIGVDFTSCTVLPLDQNGTPLCLLESFSKNPHAWVKLWKHHAAQGEANDINQIANRRNEKFLFRHGGKTSSEWMLPKILQILREAPDIYEKTDLFMEAGDWIVYLLTGAVTRNSSALGFKSLWNQREGFPHVDFLQELDERLSDLYTSKLRGDILSPGSKAGTLTVEMANRLGLQPGIVVAAASIDAHATVPALGVVTPGKMVMTMGTSTCHLLVHHKEKHVEGICGVVENGIIPGYYAYEAGQSAVGDIFSWFVNEAVPGYVNELAERANVNVHSWLELKASEYSPGETGLLALDWWNGNRSTLVNGNLSGVILGLNLLTKPEEVYRTLLEATAFGTRKIIESFQNSGIEINELFACGGLPQRNQLLLQIYADVTNREIKVSASTQTSALGAAMFAAVAAGKSNGGYDSIIEAANNMGRIAEETYKPIFENTVMYDQLYQQYNQLYELFGRGSNEVLNVLKTIKKRAIQVK